MTSENGNRPKTLPKRDFILEVTPEMSKEEVLSNLIKHLEKQGIRVVDRSSQDPDFKNDRHPKE